jgi:hypothetical protein
MFVCLKIYSLLILAVHPILFIFSVVHVASGASISSRATETTRAKWMKEGRWMEGQAGWWRGPGHGIPHYLEQQ